ncbi:MAG: hypothetical protein KKH04_05820 [Proteobacteria bacterium]|nr:hypothetical protein [Pseudomonadota bacterium]
MPIFLNLQLNIASGGGQADWPYSLIKGLIAQGNVLKNSFRTTLEMTINLFKVDYKQANLKILTIPL